MAKAQRKSNKEVRKPKKAAPPKPNPAILPSQAAGKDTNKR